MELTLPLVVAYAINLLILLGLLFAAVVAVVFMVKTCLKKSK